MMIFFPVRYPKSGRSERFAVPWRPIRA